jgi:uncharacterized protein YndB with AHSA1/START domain
MTTLENEILINASIEKIWTALATVDQLEKYDPTVKTSKATSSMKVGLGATWKVEMKGGKNWFEERCTVWNPNHALAYELTACSFPVHKLSHSYCFEHVGNKIKVKQSMTYKMKYGLFGKVLDVLIVKKQSNAGIKKFYSGLKSFVEHNTYHNGL